MTTQKINLFAYAVPTGGYASDGVKCADHTFLLTSASNPIADPNQVVDDFGCYGRGTEALKQGALILFQGTCIADWARQLYGTDPNLPTGLRERVDGVCQNVCNRILALIGGDVSAANANLYVTLLYGKYGYNLADFVQKVKDTAAQINASSPGSISDGDLETVLARFGEDPEDELENLESHFKAALPPTLSAVQTAQLLAAYRDFQAKRQGAFDGLSPNAGNPQAFQAGLRNTLTPLFLQFGENCCDILGREEFKKIFQLQPQKVLSYIIG